MKREARAVRSLHAIERVRCLECGATYAKPGVGGTVQENPGCPRCGYLGWIAAESPLRRGAHLRSGAGQQPRRSAQSR